MKLAFASINVPYERWYNLSKKYGFKAVNISSLGEYNNIGRDLLKNGLQISQIGNWKYNPLAPEEKYYEEVIKCIDIASTFDFKCSITFGSGSYLAQNPFAAHPGNWTKNARKTAANNIKPLAEYAEKKDVKISLEPHIWNVTNNAKNTIELIELVGSKNVGITLDIVNYCTVSGYFNTKSLIDKYTNLLKDYVFDIHLKDVILLPEVVINLKECPVGFGNLDINYLLKKVDEIFDNDIWAIVEHVPDEKVDETFENVFNAAREANVVFK